MIRANKTKRQGVTLVEVLISLLLLGIVFAIGFTFLDRTFVSLERQKQSLDTLHEARSFLMNIERDLREMTKVVEIDTVFKSSLFDESNALMYRFVIEVPSRTGAGLNRITYTYEGPDKYEEAQNKTKVIYRQVNGKVKKALITKQLNYLKIWGTDGTIFRNRHPSESMTAYRNYLAPHYYHPSNPARKGLKDLNKIKGIEVQLSMHELLGKDKKPIKQRTFITRIYPRILNSKFE
jgi:prepilin-type N-terminal cleavage/methylation domain-containing protein